MGSTKMKKYQDKEICICAGVKINGEVFIGHRHGQALEVMREILNWRMTGKDMISYLHKHEAIQGFVTSRRRFVSRKVGRKLQNEARIKSADKDGYRYNTLFSEDLY